MNVLVGLDPECWATKEGAVVSAHGLIEGTKEEPKLVRNGMVQVDGMALEFGIVPAATEEEFVYRIEDVMTQLQAMIPQGHTLSLTPTTTFSEEYMKEQPHEATELGCSPDFNAWTMNPNPSPDEESLLRTASGHVHVGINEAGEDANYGVAAAISKQLDFFLGLPSLLFDTDVKRREMYGKAGAYRPKSYGCEYRVLSNQWLNSEELIKLVYKNTVEGVNRLFQGELMFKKHGDIQDIINTNNKHEAIKLMKEEGISYV